MGNKFQKALRSIKEYCLWWCKSIDKDSLLDKYFNTLQELVEKETPKKPIYIERDEETDGGMACPNCRSYMGIDYESNYCTQCGQKLDWSNDDK